MNNTDNIERDEITKPEIKSDSTLKKTMKGILRKVILVLGSIVIGGLLVYFILYSHAIKNLEVTDTNLENANETIIAQDDQIKSLLIENETLQNNIDSATLHLNLLEALSGMRGASLAVGASDYAGARLLLIQASEALDTLSGQLGTDQKDVFVAMQNSASQALVDVKNNLESAQPVLDQLINNLVQLEGILFTSP